MTVERSVNLESRAATPKPAVFDGRPSRSRHAWPFTALVGTLLASLLIGLFAPSQAAAAPIAGSSTIDGFARDGVLDTLIAAAVLSNPAVRAKRSNVQAARYDIDAARWQYAPSLTTQLQQGSGPSWQSSSSIRVDQRLYAGGRLDAELGGAASRRDGSLLEVQETSLLLAQQVVGAYQSLQASQGQQRAIDTYRRKLDELSGRITRRIESGVSPQSEQALMSARIVQSATDLAAARAAEANASAALRQLSGAAGVQSSPTIDPSAGLPRQPILCSDDERGDAARGDALDRHPSVRRSLQDVESARFALEAQRAALRPSLTFRVDQPIGAVAAGVPSSARVAIVLDYSTDGLATSSRIDAGSERLVGLNEQAAVARRDIEQQIRSACADYAGAAQRVSDFRQARGFTTEVLASYTRLFVAGKRPWLDVLNAAREDFDNEQAGLVAAASLRGATYKLALLGGDYALGQPEPEGAVAPPLASILSWNRHP